MGSGSGMCEGEGVYGTRGGRVVAVATPRLSLSSFSPSRSLSRFLATRLSSNHHLNSTTASQHHQKTHTKRTKRQTNERTNELRNKRIMGRSNGRTRWPTGEVMDEQRMGTSSSNIELFVIVQFWTENSPSWSKDECSPKKFISIWMYIYFLIIKTPFF